MFDLRGALLKKGEVESARLDDFAFRLRARAMRLLASRLGLEQDALVRRIAAEPDTAILASLPAEAAALHARCVAEARAALIAERGDPAPHRLA